MDSFLDTDSAWGCCCWRAVVQQHRQQLGPQLGASTRAWSWLVTDKLGVLVFALQPLAGLADRSPR
ncbi:MAG: Uncharacterised protein [Prochlorococcus marinus str. MIT 9313]|nr:MAG: Uncharacterised protein [Prochlorococcus marinus str. MIT 9313]